MKKLLFIISVFAPLLSFAQTQSETSIRKGNIIVDAYIGGPQFLGRQNINRTVSSVSLSLSSRNFGPFGGRIEYMVTERSSFGLEINHAQSRFNVSWNDNKDRLGQEIQVNRTRIIPRYALHFGRNKLDAYAHIGLGVAIWDLDINTTDPSSTIARTLNYLPSGPMLAFRTGLGLRYFFTDNFGLHADLGLGGPLFTVGVSGKF